MTAHYEQKRGITERIHISGTLVLETPAHFGNGQIPGETMVDMCLLLDEAEGRALIPGTTLAGALRSYLCERLYGYGESEPDQSSNPLLRLFGPLRQTDRATAQSALIVEDALAEKHTTTLRDGVRIDAKTGTAYVKHDKAAEGQTRTQGAKFDVELLQAGTSFELHFELALCGERDQALLPLLAAALHGLEQGEIRLGARKRRGYGQCRVQQWTVSRYDLCQPADLCAWLETPSLEHRSKASSGDIATALSDATGLAVHPTAADRRRRFVLDATFSLEGSSLLIRSGFGRTDVGPDMEHMHALGANGKRHPVIPGTSWAGVVRHRAVRIAKTVVGKNRPAKRRAKEAVDELFGWMPEAKSADNDIQPWASRVTVDETPVKGGQVLYQTRVRIDRFTGGALETALFEQAPLYGTSQTRVQFNVQVRNPKPHEIGLLLLVLKDLWTGDLPVGGEASVGRGRLRGLSAELCLPDGETINLDQDQQNLGLSADQSTLLQGYVNALWKTLHGDEEAGDD